MKPPAFILKAGLHQDQETGHKYRTCLFSHPLRQRNGFIFSLSKVEKKHSRELRNICQIITSQAGRLASSFDKSVNVQNSFEQFLAALNQQFAEQIRSGVWNFPIEDLQAVVGLACEQEMYLSGTGELTTIFLHKTEAERYQIFNLSRNISNEQSLLTWEKAFSVILDGDLSSGDIFCTASEPFQPTIANDELHEILTTLPAKSAASKIRQYFPHESGMDILVIKAQGGQAAPVLSRTLDPIPSYSSIEHLTATEKQTAKLLKDQKPGGLLIILKTLLGKLKPSSDSKTLKEKIPAYIKKVSFWLGKNYIARQLKGRVKKTRVAKEKAKLAKQRAFHALENMNPNRKSLPGSVKYLFLAAFSVLIIFSVSIYYLTRDNTQAQEQAGYQAQIQEINSLIEQGAAAIIYKDENQARNFYSQAQSRLNELPQTAPLQVSRALELQKEIDQAQDQLRHVINIPDPPLVADFSALEDFVRAQSFTFYNGQLYIFTNNKGVLLANLAEKTFSPIELTVGEVGIPLASASDENSIYFLDNRPGVSGFDPENKNLRITQLSPPENNQWVDLELYGGNLYLIQINNEASDGQVIRLAKVGQSFGSATEWINSKSINLQNASGLAIDGTIFVLKEDGQVIRFARGSEIGWETGLVEPAIVKAAKIWTDVDSDHLYVLEPLGQRVIVYQKETGQFLVQYLMKSLNNIKDFQIDEANRKIYLLTDQALYSVNLSH